MKSPHQLLSAALSRKLSPSEANSLSTAISTLEERLLQCESHNARLRADHQQTLTSERVYVELESAALRLTFPEQHSVRVPLSEQTQHDMAMAMHMLLRILRSRHGAKNIVGAPGAPTQFDVRAVLAALKGTPATKVGKRPAKALADLIDLDNLVLPQ